MRRMIPGASALCLTAAAVAALAAAAPSQSPNVQQVDLAEWLKAGKLRAVNREVTPSQVNPRGVHLSESAGNGIVWVNGTDFAQGTIEVDVRGRDLFQRSFVGVAFHGKDDRTYDAVYLRPFNFRSDDPVRKQHAVQYIAMPDYDWPRLRKEFPEEFENPVDESVSPADSVPLRVVVKDKAIQVYIGTGKSVALEVRKLGSSDRGMVGLWVGNGSDGDFANLRLTPAK